MSLVLSALLHLLVVLLLPTFQVETPGPASEADDDGEPRDRGVEIVELTEVPGDDPGPLIRPAPPEDPEEPAEEEVEEEAPEEAPVEPTEDGDAGEGPTVAERLRTPTTGDARLWRPVDPDLTELTPDERALIGIYIRLQAMSDSVVAAEERERQAREWVFTDDEGRRWGISPGTIYFGEDSIQVPLLDRFQLSGPPTVEEAARQWELNDIRRAADVARVRDAWDERRDAIRERVDAEREEARSREAEDTQPADSTGSGGS
ncbi:MAG: hypothetical protein R3223_03985 [Longimicrobiales bacterium]|nr:hypothetical protein [Longimicrobiales bacterium]